MSSASDHPTAARLAVGLRLGEAVGLQVGDIRGSQIRVARQITLTSEGAVQGPPKHGRSRDVPVPAFVLNMLPLDGRTAGEWLFTNRAGGPFDARNWQSRAFRPAAERAGLAGMHPHELRHTAASLAIQSVGCEVGPADARPRICGAHSRPLRASVRLCAG